jgi:hypothetical protein
MPPRSKALTAAFRYFRSRRMHRFVAAFGVTAETRVLDIGGSPEIWTHSPVRPRLTIVNLPSAIEGAGALAEEVAGDGLALPFRDRAFDIAFSNSVIEHVGSREHQRQFAREVARVAASYWVETPNRGFPVEQHMMVPGLHFLPRSLQARVLRKFTVWELVAHPPAEQKAFYVQHYLNDVRLLDAGELASLFPDADISAERLFGLKKSLVALRKA